MRDELIGAIVHKLNESSISDLHQLVEILYENELLNLKQGDYYA